LCIGFTVRWQASLQTIDRGALDDGTVEISEILLATASLHATPHRDGLAWPVRGGPMADNGNVAKFPLPVPVATPDEVITEARRLAALPAGVWRAHYRASAKRLGIPAKDFEHMVAEIVRVKRAEKAADQRRRERKAKSKESLFERLQNLSEPERREEIANWCDEYEENPEAIAQEFRESVGPEDVDLWPEPVSNEEMSAVVEQVLGILDRYVVMTYGSAQTVNRAVLESEAARTMLPFALAESYVPGEIAIYSPIVTPYGPSKDSGKTTLLQILSWLARVEGKPEYYVSPRVSLYARMGRGRPLFIEEGARIYRNAALEEIITASYTYGSTVPRHVGKNEKDYPVWCATFIAMTAPKDIPATAWSRHVGFMMLPQLESETREKWKNRDTEEFEMIRRKFARWIIDNLAAIDIGNKNPALPVGWVNCTADNWRTKLAIADLVGGKWPKLLREAAVMLEPNDENDPRHIRLLRGLRTYIRDEQKDRPELLPKRAFYDYLRREPDSEWHGISMNLVSHEFRQQFHVTTDKKIGPSDERQGAWDPLEFAEFFARILKDPLPMSGPKPSKKLRKKKK
jgi:hypothetical protein